MSNASNISRRNVIAIGAAAAAGVTVGASTAVAASQLGQGSEFGAVGQLTVPFFGKNQPGIATPVQAAGTFVAFTLKPDADTSSVGRLLRLWTSDISLLMAGRPAMADSNPELAATPARLTVTVGLGFEAFNRAGVPYEYPVIARELPAYKTIDALEPQWVGGDLLLQVCADDALSVSHAVRELIKDAAPFADVRWIQKGFAPHAGVNAGETPRNLMGQVDGTDNPSLNGAEFSSVVFSNGERHPWFANGSTFVLRRIRMQLDTWEKLSPEMQEKVIGRNRKNGAPLTGVNEKDTPDYLAKNPDGSFVIPEDAHIRRASTPLNIFRRVYNYDDGITAGGVSDAGLLFATYQAELSQYLEIQSLLAEKDSLNRWTTPVGSAVFAILPGCEEGDYLGSAIFA